MLDRSDLLHFTLHTAMHNLVEGMILVSIILFLFLLNVRAALIVRRRQPDRIAELAHRFLSAVSNARAG